MGYFTTTVDRYCGVITDELPLLKDVTVTNTSNEVDFETVEDTEDTLELGKDDKDEDYVPEIEKGKYDMFRKLLVVIVNISIKNFNMLDMVIGL